MTRAGYIKRSAVSIYRAQRRGGRGRRGAAVRDEDPVEHLFVASTHDFLLVFTSIGKVYWLKVHEVPEASPAARGKAIVNLLPVAQDEKVAALVAVKEFDPKRFLLFATRKGKVKKTELDAYANPRSTGIIAVALEEGDDLLDVRLTEGDSHVFLGTHKGLGIRFPESGVRPMGRVAAGVRGISLRGDDFVETMAAFPADDKGEILVVSERGFGKRTPVADFREQGRGGKGITLMKVTSRTGSVAGMRHLGGDDDIMLVTAQGMMIRTSRGGRPSQRASDPGSEAHRSRGRRPGGGGRAPRRARGRRRRDGNVVPGTGRGRTEALHRHRNCRRDHRGRSVGILDGVTTNPSLVAREGRSYHELVAEICRIVPGPVSAEVLAMDADGMEREGRELAGIAENVVVKLPITQDGIRVCARFSEEGIATNLTLCFSPAQALLVAKAGATYVSPFVGRIDDVGHDGMQLVRGESCRSTTRTSSRRRFWWPRCGTRSTSSKALSPAPTSRRCRSRSSSSCSATRSRTSACSGSSPTSARRRTSIRDRARFSPLPRAGEGRAEGFRSGSQRPHLASPARVRANRQ